jgi:ABC-type sugar transport system ATPase subunit
MIGRDASAILRKKEQHAITKSKGELVCQVRGLSRGEKPKAIDRDLYKGQVLGLAGLLGSGRTELVRILFGDDAFDQGEIKVEGRRMRFRSPRDAIRSGLGFCPEDRKAEGIMPHMSVADNIVLAILPQLNKWGIVSRKKKRNIAERYIEKLNIKATSHNQLIRNLSGGNQQKVLLARWLCSKPLLMILDEPTRGIDVGAKAEVEGIIQELAAGGISVLMVSTEIEELIRNCERIAVLRNGQKVGELEGDRISETEIMSAIAQANGPY